jgi:hypothetical protein
MLRKALKEMGRAKLIGTGKHQLIPPTQPGGGRTERNRSGGRPFLTKHTGLPKTPKRSSRRK